MRGFKPPPGQIPFFTKITTLPAMVAAGDAKRLSSLAQVICSCARMREPNLTGFGVFFSGRRGLASIGGHRPNFACCKGLVLQVRCTGWDGLSLVRSLVPSGTAPQNFPRPLQFTRPGGGKTTAQTSPFA